MRLRFTANTGAPGGQVAEFQVFGEPAPNPDLTVTAVSWTPANPTETDAITLSATVRNAGDVASGATTVTFRLGEETVGTADVGELAPGATATVTRKIGPHDAGEHTVTAVVDEANKVIERDEGNNAHTAPVPAGGPPGGRLRPGRRRGLLDPRQPGRGRRGHLHRDAARTRAPSATAGGDARHHAHRARLRRRHGHDAHRRATPA